MKKGIIIIIFCAMQSCLFRLSKEEKVKLEREKLNTKSAVSEWIINNAIYPNSYESIEFKEYMVRTEYNWNKEVANSKEYCIHHTHKLLDKDSIIRTFGGYFILDNEYNVCLIDTINSNYGCSFPPKIDSWTFYFGKSLSKEDSLNLEKRKNEKIEEFIYDFDNLLNDKNIYYLDTQAIEDLKKAIEKNKERIENE